MAEFNVIIFYLEEFEEKHVGKLRRAMNRQFESHNWNEPGPEFVDELDQAGCTRPEDQPVRTVGIAWQLPIPDGPRDWAPSTLTSAVRSDLELVIDFLRRWTTETQTSVGVEISDIVLGSIHGGDVDPRIEQALLAAPV